MTPENKIKKIDKQTKSVKRFMALKKFKNFILGVFVLSLIVMAVVWVYRYERDRTHRDLARRIAELNPKGGTPQSIESLKAVIAAYEQQIELNVKEGAQTGSYWKILALRLADKGMHQQAIDAIERAIYYNAEDPALFYYTGESASAVAAASLPFSANGSEKEHFTRLAEEAYLRAIAMDVTYAKPRLGLGILYTFELNRPVEAIPHLERYMELSPRDIKGMFVLARACYMTENFDRAVELYDRIIAQTKDQKVKAEAQNNKEIIRNLIYG